jgi:hypothetical protein
MASLDWPQCPVKEITDVFDVTLEEVKAVGQQESWQSSHRISLENWCALAAKSGSPATSSPYSFSVEAQPAAAGQGWCGALRQHWGLWENHHLAAILLCYSLEKERGS